MPPNQEENAPRGPAAALLSGRENGVIFTGPRFAAAPFAGLAPVEILEGGWDDWGKLDDALRSGRGDLGGWFDYEGGFRFGLFPAWMEAGDLPPPRGHALAASFEPGVTREAWTQRVEAIRDYIGAGDIYQANLTHAFTAAWPGEAGTFFPHLLAASPAPYSCFLRLGDTTVLSVSPECFLEIEGRGIRTRPIKGTRARHPDAAQDAAAVRELLSSDKERAELVMITDLERNDLGQVCDYGSVRVTGLCELQTFAQVHHLVSTVEGALRPEVSPLQALRACYPGGSITGAPKKRAREIIMELEQAPRGIYTGALGFFRRDGRAIFNIAIRTLVIRDGVASYGTGAGIVADSRAAAEYEETLHKAAGLFAALGQGPSQGMVRHGP